MANPAELLHAQLLAWRRKGDLNDIRKVPSDDGWEAMRFAVLNLDNCLTLMERLKADGVNVQGWEVYKNTWHKCVFGYDVAWNSTNKSPSGGVDEHALNALMSLSAFLGVYVPKLEDNGLGSIQEMLESDILNTPSDGYPAELLAYFKRVKTHLEWCVENFNKVGEFELHEAAMQFRMVVLFMTDAAPTDEEKGRWGEFWKERFVWPFVSTTVTTGPAELASSGLWEVGQRILELLP